MKMEFEVQEYMVIPLLEKDRSSSNLARHIFCIPVVSYGNNIGGINSEVTINFPDGFEALYKWNSQKNQWDKMHGDGKKVLKFPIPVMKNEVK